MQDIQFFFYATIILRRVDAEEEEYHFHGMISN